MDPILGGLAMNLLGGLVSYAGDKLFNPSPEERARQQAEAMQRRMGKGMRDTMSNRLGMTGSQAALEAQRRSDMLRPDNDAISTANAMRSNAGRLEGLASQQATNSMNAFRKGMGEQRRALQGMAGQMGSSPAALGAISRNLAQGQSEALFGQFNNATNQAASNIAQASSIRSGAQNALDQSRSTMYNTWVRPSETELNTGLAAQMANVGMPHQEHHNPFAGLAQGMGSIGGGMLRGGIENMFMNTSPMGFNPPPSASPPPQPPSGASAPARSTPFSYNIPNNWLTGTTPQQGFLSNYQRHSFWGAR